MSPRSSDPTRPSRGGLGQLLEIPGCELSVTSGPDSGRSLAVAGRAVRLGKSEDCDLALTDPTVSRHHAVVEPGPRGYSIEDLGSRNGTSVNGVPVQRALLVPGCRIMLGDTELTFTPVKHQLTGMRSQVGALESLTGSSDAMREVYGLIRLAAPTEATVVLRGETGSGKEVAARALHALSARKTRPFVVVDCANVNRDLLGSELFGHCKGAFTGAIDAHAGAFDRASGGTVFLDEVGELPVDLQTRLLGVLQRREVQPIGAGAPHPVDVRVVAATHRDLEGLSGTGGFRPDLYFRLAVVTIHLPPLRERLDDIPLLVERFLRELIPPGRPAVALAPDAMKRLASHAWPGNVRELRNTVERALVLSGALTAGDVTTIDERHLVLTPTSRTAAPTGTTGALDRAERELVERALQKHAGNRMRAAAELGIARSTLRRKIREYGLEDGTDDD